MASPPLYRSSLNALLLLFLTTTLGCSQRNPLGSSSELMDLGLISPFSLTERDGSTVTRADLMGAAWIANFIFTRCKGPCPTMSAQMARIQRILKARGSRTRLVSFSVDPLIDTPQVLTPYAEKFGADGRRWLFLTGPIDLMYALIKEGFKLPVGPPPADQAQTSDFIIHTTRFVVVDPRGHLRGYFDSTDANFQKRLLEAVTALEKVP